ncbi:exopolyphosphatase domain protein [Mycobacterium kansasii 824]|nr:exopolyphosphatase domain protein [Mycobacterium kansasii 824]
MAMSGSGRRIAAIDCGTNSIRLLIAEATGARLHDVHRETRIVRLGQGVDATGELARMPFRAPAQR